MKFSEIKQFTRKANYCVDINWGYMPDWIKNQQNEQYNLELDPDFQRAHVWTKKQQERYIEFILKGGEGSRDIYWNCSGWMSTFKGPMVLVDGKQRINAVEKFLDNKIKAFGYHHKEYEDKLSIIQTSFRFHVNNLETRAEVLQWYLDLNFGGTPHTEAERKRVINLLKEES